MEGASRSIQTGMGTYEIYVMDADGSNVTQLTYNPADDHQAHWSPDGEHFVFLSERDGDPEIYVMDTDGSNVTQLTHNDAVDWAPQWSPTEGKRSCAACLPSSVKRRSHR